MNQDRKPQRLSSRSVDQKAQNYANAANPYMTPVPKGYKFDTHEEKELWEAFTGARPRTDWLPHDLILLAKVVELELKIRQFKSKLEQEGYIVENQRGTMVENAYFRVYQTALQMQLSIIRALSMTTPASAPSTTRKQAKDEQEAVANLEKKGALSLIASRN